jgi:uncharacterized coiled-coil DUF342 family protein
MASKAMQLSIDQLYRELEELREANAHKKTEINLLRRQIEDALKKRDLLNGEVKRASDDVRKLKAQRDSLNAKVKELKLKRDELRNVASQKREVLSKLLEQARQISEQLQGSMSDLSRQIKRLEWFIQTNPLAPQTERNVVAKIGELEISLVKHKGLRNVRDKLLRLKVEVGGLRIQAQASHEQLTKIAEESEQVHTSMQELIKVLAQKKKEADEKHAEFVELSKQRQDAVSVLRQNLDRIDQIRAQIGEEKTSTRIEKAEKLKSKYKEAANEKVRTGGKLSFEEFKALMSDSLADTDEE